MPGPHAKVCSLRRPIRAILGCTWCPCHYPADVYGDYYGRISNEVLWMLHHQVIGHGGYEQIDEQRHHAWTKGYLEANHRLAVAVSETCPEAKGFLVQDYHLYPLPALLRTRFPRAPILHFTHIPFPEPSVLKLIPSAWRETILRGMLGADVVGLQTPADVEAFLACCTNVLGMAIDPIRSTVMAEGRRVRVRAYPASVDFRGLQRLMQSNAVMVARRRLEPRLKSLNIIRVDRLDPSKNQLIGFRAFARLLELRPDLRPSVRFLAFLIPSRTDLDIYRAYRDAVYQCIDEINSQYADECGRPPIEVFYTNDRDQALAAMESCDVLMVNSLKDGMNLVAKEWAVVSQRPGVLILSETAGVVEEASDSALLVSPLDVEGTAKVMAEALEMPEPERAERLARFRDRVARWTAQNWLSAQLDDLGLGAVFPGRPVGRPGPRGWGRKASERFAGEGSPPAE